MDKYIFCIGLISSLWHMSLSFHQCDRTINGAQIIFSCNSTLTELNLYDLTASQLNSITSIIGRARDNSSRGPFTFIPPNICLLPNLQTVDFSYNRIVNVDPTQSLSDCFTNVVTLNLQYNNIITFPSVLVYSMPSLRNLNFQGNQLTEVPVYAFMNISAIDTIDFSYNQLTSFELWAIEVQTKADFSHNQISTITNKYFFTEFLASRNYPSILLTNNTPTINFTDAVFEMYNQCEDVLLTLENANNTFLPFAWKLALTDFGTTQILCNCDQVYLRSVVQFGTGGINPGNPIFAIGNARCSNSSTSNPGEYFITSDCPPIGGVKNSSVNFTNVYPRLCKIYESDGGLLTPIPNITDPIPTISYPHYDSAVLNPGACFFNFTSATTMTIVACSNESTSSSSQISNAILDSSYMANVNRITFPTVISSYPSYLCSLPSAQINLSGQNFTSLADATFSCLDSFNRITLSNNQIATVTISNGNFQNLTYLDLSSNRLTQLPYSILRPTPTSLRILDLRNNSITQIDLFIYTLKNITIYLDNNPITSTNLTNPQNATVNSNSTSSVNVTYPSTVANLSAIIQDSVVATLISCADFPAVQSTLNAIRMSTNGVLLCTCASFTLKQIYLQNGLNITQYISCSNATELQSFLNLTNASCLNAVYIRQPPCNDTQTPINGTTTAASNTSTTFTSTSFTPTTTLIASNETQTATLSENVTASENTTVGGNSSTTTVLTGNTTVSTTTNLFGNATVSSNTTETGATTSTFDTTTTAPTLPPVQSGRDQDPNRIPLIVGLVVGLVGGALLIGGIIGTILFLKSKNAAKKKIKRGKLTDPESKNTINNRVRTRNPRAVRLAPIPPTSHTPLPDVPVKAVAPTTNGTLLSNPNPTLRTTAKGIPIRPDAVRSPTDIRPQYPPNSNALTNSSSFRPINNLTTPQTQTPQPRQNPILNKGGDLRFEFNRKK